MVTPIDSVGFLALTLEFFIVITFALVHLLSNKLRFLQGIPRSRWLSFAGGISVAYVFIHVFPELAEAQELLSEADGGLLPFLEHHAYLVALLGLGVFYGLERMVKVERDRPEPTEGREGETQSSLGVYCLHIGSFALYNALIGYLLVHREEQDTRGLVFFGIAMALHFLVNDFALQHDHQDSYRRVGRWVLIAALLLGWGLGLATEIDRAALGVLFAFLAGGVILNVLKEELPEERKSRFWAFAVGAVSYVALLLLV